MKYVNKRPKTSKIKRTNKKEFGHGSARSISYWRYPRKAKSWCFCAVLTKESALDAMRIGTHSFPSSREQTKIIYLQNVHFCFFENTLVNTGLLSSTSVTFHFLLCHLQGANWTWNLQKFVYNHVFPVLRIYKYDAMVLTLWHVVDTVSANMPSKF